MGKSQGTPLLAAGGNGPASTAYGCVKQRLAFTLESPLDESGGQAREIKLKSFRTGAAGLALGRFNGGSDCIGLLTVSISARVAGTSRRFQIYGRFDLIMLW